MKYIEGSPCQEWGSCGGWGREQPEAGSQCVDGGNEGPTGQHPTDRPTCGEPGRRGSRGEGGGGVGLTSQGQGSEDQELTLLGEGEWVKGQSFEKYRQLDLTKSNEVHLLNWHWVSSFE